ncbi:hypothetical protein DMR_38430 [Solidesulfovibrio magneticus RS-1]|uniref:Uncharacterized protein n=1 Tax=Solidesulfovibrio magneticus (strain ATCC 700980 / DSM 13731 / RS-1) TaxID=573370 RepID=C4XN31_SOLM1|nr:hypothetical protein DMR_38430 [Solidesulfovibrio magneticus RS-1]
MLSRAGWRQPAFFMVPAGSPDRATGLADWPKQDGPKPPLHHVFLSNTRKSIDQAYLTMPWGVITR